MIASKNLICLVLSMYFFNYSFAELINCTVENNLPPNVNEKISIGPGVILVEYDRNELGVYKYNNTESVNVLIEDINVVYDGVLISKLNGSHLRVNPSIHTIIEGSAILTENNTLEYCNLEVKSSFKNSKNLSINLQEKLFFATKSCIEATVCKQIGKIDQDDSLRAKIEPHEFGENSVLLSQLNQKFPNMELSRKSVDRDTNKLYNDPSGIQTTLNIISDFLLASLVDYASGRELGQIELPNFNQILPGAVIISDGYFNLTNGTFSDLKNIMRTENIHVMNDGLHFYIKVGIQIPRAHIKYSNYNFHYFWFNRNGDMSIDVESITLAIQIEINFNRSPCKTSTSYVRSRIEGIRFEMSGGGILDALISKTVNFAVDKFAREIVSYVKLKLKEAISGPLESFDCERYRP